MKEVYLLVKKKESKFVDVILKEDGFGYILMTTEEEKNNELDYRLYKDDSIKFLIKRNERIIDAVFEREEIYSEHSKFKKYYDCIESKNKLGIFYPRIYRPTISYEKIRMTTTLTSDIEKSIKKAVGIYTDLQLFDKEVAISSINQLSILNSQLDFIFQSVHPSPINLKTYSHNIRNLLILVCTEVEAQLKGIINENIKVKKKVYNTKDYVKLNSILRLNEYELGFSYYPSISHISPFKNWDSNNPTKSLKWYDDYNAVKHDREGQFNKATLINAINGICALAILYVAQFGKENTFWKEKIKNSFTFTKEPKWSSNEFYIPPLRGSNWVKAKKNL